jgi:lipoyl(octanoyl) transferase
MDYEEARILQEAVVKDRSLGALPDTLLLLEHPHTITFGRRGQEANLLVPRESLEEHGIAVYHTDRGGDVTYHGPGQLVGYPIVNIRNREGRVSRYLRDLEKVMILTLAEFGVAARTLPGLTGVWVGNEKIAAIGIKVNAKGITGHGFALNLTTDLSFFDKIVPCGIRDKKVTSLKKVLGHPVPLLEAAQKVAEAFLQVFDMQLANADLSDLEASLQARQKGPLLFGNTANLVRL